MGHYTGRCFRMTFKKSTPPALISIIKECALFGDASDSTEVATVNDAKVTEDISYLMCCSSAYLEGWNSRKFEQDEDGRWHLLTYASTTRSMHDSLRSFLAACLPYLEMEDGAIVYRDIYESGSTERVIFLDGGKYYCADGYDYRENGRYDDPTFDNPDHPWQGKEGEHPFEPEWNFYVLHGGRVEAEKKVQNNWLE